MTGYELLQLIDDHYCYGDKQETIVVVNELIHRIYNENKKLGCELEKELEDLVIPLGLCPLCGSELETTRSLQYSEYCGKEVSEEIFMICCSDGMCSYTLTE